MSEDVSWSEEGLSLAAPSEDDDTQALVSNTSITITPPSGTAGDGEAVLTDTEASVTETEAADSNAGIMKTQTIVVYADTEAGETIEAAEDGGLTSDIEAMEADDVAAETGTVADETAMMATDSEPTTAEAGTAETKASSVVPEVMFLNAEASAGSAGTLQDAGSVMDAESAAAAAGDGRKVLLFTLLGSDLGDGGDTESNQVTLHSAPVAADGPAKIETRLAVREALIPSRRSSRPPARPPRCRACGGPPGKGAGGYCDDCTVAAGTVEGEDGEECEPPVPPCADCGRLFDSAYSLVSHRANEHGGTIYPCAFCGREFLRRADLKSHMNLHLGIKKSVCDVCGRQFSHMSNLYRHRRIHTGERPYVCSVCGKRFSQANALSAHAETHEVKSMHMCPFCPKKFRNRSQLAGHIRLMHQSEVQQPMRRQSQAGRRFHCGVCGARLDSRAKLRRHLADHPADSLRCAVCQEAFPSAEELTRHACSAAARAAEEEEEETVVDLSDAEEPVTKESAGAEQPARPRSSFMLSDSRERKEEEPAGLLAAADRSTEVDNLMEELVAVQSVGTQYDVNEILYLTETERLGSPPAPPTPPPPPEPEEPEKKEGEAEDGEEQHLDKVIEDVARGGAGSPDSAEQFPCSTCGRMFSRLSNLRQHEAMHDATLQRFKCDKCDLTFAWQQTRDRHVLKMHTDNIKRVPCPAPGCKKTFMPDSLRGHIKRIHLKERNYGCYMCSKTFHGRSELQDHVRSHTQERPYVCCTCGRQFGYLGHLRRHEEVHERLEEEEAARARRDGLRTYQSRRAPARIAPRPPPGAPAQDIVKHSLESARIPLRLEGGGALPPGTRLVAAGPLSGGITHLVPVSGSAPAGQPVVVAGAPPPPPPPPAEDVVTAVVGPECKEIIIVECEV
ncbi:Zinc finger protein 91 [Amphibalanus amphitrite]|uniref:Zinc finger protein 91 n=1 Tax=Amphibalanus amphitrite TaxID=1232801 RepID=A0A6A4VGY8_AMPAM|nr:Zinc finger protein 91 [Amphibalanus amphitrite]